MSDKFVHGHDIDSVAILLTSRREGRIRQQYEEQVKKQVKRASDMIIRIFRDRMQIETGEEPSIKLAFTSILEDEDKENMALLFTASVEGTDPVRIRADIRANDVVDTPNLYIRTTCPKCGIEHWERFNEMWPEVLRNARCMQCERIGIKKRRDIDRQEFVWPPQEVEE